MRIGASKIVLAVLVLVAVGLLLIQLEHYSAGRRVEQFLAQTRQVSLGMTEDGVVQTLGEPVQRMSVHPDDPQHEACRRIGATRILTYSVEYRGWFGGLGLDTGWEMFIACIDKEGRVVDTAHVTIQVDARESLQLDSPTASSIAFIFSESDRCWVLNENFVLVRSRHAADLKPMARQSASRSVTMR